MNKKTQSRRKPKKGKVPFDKTKFVIDNLTSAQLKHHDEQWTDDADLFDLAEKITEYGGQLSQKKDDYSGAFMATIIFNRYGYVNSEYALSARGNSIRDCLSIVLYKFFVVAEADCSDIADEIREVRG